MRVGTNQRSRARLINKPHLSHCQQELLASTTTATSTTAMTTTKATTIASGVEAAAAADGHQLE
jgi:hypothetical protein